MYDDLKENIILLMQHPIARRPISNLSDEEREKAFDLLNYLSTLSVDENYTLLDYIQMARLEYALGHTNSIFPTPGKTASCSKLKVSITQLQCLSVRKASCPE